MYMPAVTLLAGLLLTAAGVGLGNASAAEGVARFIPAVLGVVLLLCGVVSLKKAARMHAIHVALMVALLGVVGAGIKAVDGVLNDGTSQVLLLQLAMLVICAGYITLGIRSFIAARKARKLAAKAGA